jgi:hypothetical protein
MMTTNKIAETLAEKIAEHTNTKYETILALIAEAFQPVGWCVFDNNGIAPNNQYWETADDAITQFIIDDKWDDQHEWSYWQSQGYTVERVYREVKHG